MTREETGAWCRARGLAWRDDASQRPRRSSRAGACATACWRRCEAVDARAAANVVRTAELLREEAEVLDVVVDTALAGRDRIALLYLARPPAGARAAHRPPPGRGRHRGLCGRVSGRLDDILALGKDGALDVGDGARAVVSGGVLRFEATPPLPASS